jgi:hypothetical protein
LARCLAFRYNVRFALIAADARTDIHAAIGRLDLRRGAFDDEGQHGEKHYSLHVQSSIHLGRLSVLKLWVAAA